MSWCGDVTNQCTPFQNNCDGKVQCMNGADEDTCWAGECVDVEYCNRILCTEALYFICYFMFIIM